jgi:2-methylcitrate dehydratase PrpD
MSEADVFLLAEQMREAVDDLASFALDTLTHRPAIVTSRVELMLTDLFGVTVAGARTPEVRALVDAWGLPPGDVPLPGTPVRTSAESAAYLSAVAACLLELDEGNKYAAGHPAAHVVFAAVAAARTAGHEVSGARFVGAVAAGYEVAARFGQASVRDPRWHPHGSWGATGAACAAALLLDPEPEARTVAAAIDSATGLMHVTPWPTVLAGDFTRNLWIAGANQAGLNAARLARAGLARNLGAAAHSLGDLMGTLHPDVLVEDLGQRWLTTEGYLKRHSSCSYTHVAVDLVQELQRTGAWASAEDVAAVRVRVHSLAAPLLGRGPATRLEAMFSLPFVVSTAVVSGRVDPDVMNPESRAFEIAEAFSPRVEVVVDERLDAYLPALRCAEVEVVLWDGSSVGLAQSNPVGDVDHLPLGLDEVVTKLTGLIGASDTERVLEVTQSLAASSSVTEVLDRLP